MSEARRAGIAMLAAVALFVALGAAVTIRRDDSAAGERSHRHRLVKRLEQRLTAAARRQVASGHLEGPIIRTRCLPFEDFDPDDLSARRGRYSCVVVTFETEANYSGHTYIGSLDYRTGRVGWYRTFIPIYLGI
jgi:hypothetical protein